MRRRIGLCTLAMLAGAMWVNVADADQPNAGMLQRFFHNNECPDCTSSNGKQRRPATVLYPVRTPGQQYIEPTPNCLRRPWTRRGFLCATHRDDFGVASWRTNMRFVFGSSRSFFGEPCNPEPSLIQRIHNHFSGHHK